MKTILGLDPGYDRLGWAVCQAEGSNFQVLKLGTIQTDKTLQIYQRYLQLVTQLIEVINLHQPSQAAIETLFFSKNKSTALGVSEVRGVCIAHLLQAGIQIYDYSPNQVKLTVTGSGRADKRAVQKMIKLQVKLPLAEAVQLDDALDAVAICLTHAMHQRQQ